MSDTSSKLAIPTQYDYSGGLFTPQSLTISKNGLTYVNFLGLSKLLQFENLTSISQDIIAFNKNKISLKGLTQASIFIDALRRQYYQDIYRPLIPQDIINVEYFYFTPHQLIDQLLKLYHLGWKSPLEFLNLYANTLFFDNGLNARCLQAVAVLHFLQKGEEPPKYIKLITDVRGAGEILVMNLPAELRENLPLEFIENKPSAKRFKEIT